MAHWTIAKYFIVPFVFESSLFNLYLHRSWTCVNLSYVTKQIECVEANWQSYHYTMWMILVVSWPFIHRSQSRKCTKMTWIARWVSLSSSFWFVFCLATPPHHPINKYFVFQQEFHWIFRNAEIWNELITQNEMLNWFSRYRLCDGNFNGDESEEWAWVLLLHFLH